MKASKPKKPASAYSRFHRDHLTSLKEDNPDMPLDECVSITSKMWSKLKPEDKKKYEDYYNRVKDKYEAAMRLHN